MHSRFIVGLAIAALCLQTSFASGKKPLRPVLAYQVGELRAVVVSGRDGSPWLRVSAKAWAPHAGYTRPRLLAVTSSAAGRLFRVRFVVDPPASDGFWPMVLTEMEGVALVPLASYERVLVRGHDSAATALIDPSGPVFPAHWGSPPSVQTKDWIALPAKYGFGSSTLGDWITQKLLADVE